MHQTVLFYKYVHIEDPQAEMANQRQICEKLGMTGRMIIAQEGINATLEATSENISEYIKFMESDPQKRFQNIQFKLSESSGSNFPRLSIKVRPEIVSSHLKDKDFDPNRVSGKYVYPDELHEWFKNNEEMFIVDMRNGYEQKSGYFKGSINSEFENFRDLPKIHEKIGHLKGKKVVTVCTGGIRCEKASGYLVNEGYENVYQLWGGIQTYMEKFPGDDFLGKLYVFDGRVLVSFNQDPSKDVVVGQCDLCNEPSEIYKNCANLNCHKHFIVCEKCLEKTSGVPFCSDECEKSWENKEGNNQRLQI